MAWKSFHLSAGIVSAAALPFYLGSRGAENLPAGPCLVAAHHASFLDGPLIALAYAKKFFRPLHLIAYQEPFGNWLMGWILRSGGCIPFRRGDRGSQSRMLMTALGWLAAGEAVGIFPEAHINQTGALSRPRPGLALLALESGLPVVPAAAPGSEHVFPLRASFPRPGRRLRVVFGTSLELSPRERLYSALPREERLALVRGIGFRIMSAIAGLAGKRTWKGQHE
ncbi:MAG: 1-acyl-sn-glycerol-3-phosphate acyltransferase [Planctomycetota bacterium]|jgi:1-acyl-sn-glycerol-3-phosphate acyltransferase|nr:1-acyl-sn-glycerol-3-phosphate acyltransferase [Planctomycetota bacterium]